MTLKQKILCALMKLGCDHAGTRVNSPDADHHRWSANDLATDLAGLLDGAPVAEVGETTQTDSEAVTYQKITGDIETLHLKVGCLEVDLDGVCRGKVLVDGESFPVRKLVVTAEVGHPAKMEAERYLLHRKAK